MNFRELGLSERILKALDELNFETPTPIQEQSIPLLLADGIDLMGLAQTGTGKTAAFGIPILEKIDVSIKTPQALVLCPTRELCLQITSDIQKYSKYCDNLRTVAVYGGASIGAQIKELRRGVQIVVATPGRMIDIIERGEVNFEAIKVIVLDEADEMLNMGFKESINEILSNTPTEKNTWLFTATMPNEIRQISKKYMKNPIEVKVSVNTGNVNIEHEYYVVKSVNKYLALKRLVDYNPDIFAIVFCNTKIDTKEIADMLIRDGYNSDALHGDLTQQQRDIVMNRYREKSLQILVATDVAARGIDVSNVTHVINYQLPDDIESYTHRTGRTGRAGKTGVAMNLILSRDVYKIREIEKLIGKRLLKCEIPNGFDVCEKQLFSLVHKVHNVEVNDELISPYLEKIYAEFNEMSKEEVIRRFASLEFNRFLDYYKDANDLNEMGRDKQTNKVENNGAYQRFFINIGSLDDLMRGDLLRVICDTTGINGASVGRIDMKGMFSFFEVEIALVDQVMDGFKQNVQVKGRSVRIEKASAQTGGGGGRDDRGGDRGGERRGGERSYGGGNRRSGGDRRDGGRSGGGDRGGYGRDEKREGGFFNREQKSSERSFSRRSDSAPRRDDAGPKREYAPRREDSAPRREESALRREETGSTRLEKIQNAFEPKSGDAPAKTDGKGKRNYDRPKNYFPYEV